MEYLRYTGSYGRLTKNILRFERFLRPLSTPGPEGPPHTQLPALRYALLEPYGRDSIINILKLVINLECHRKVLMRPGILPISKN